MTVDANIIIAYLAGDQAVIELLTELKRDGKPLFIPTIAEAEVLSFSGWSAAERRVTEDFLDEHFTSIPFDRTVARIAAHVRRETKIKFPDAAIAATALATHTPLLTRNYRDFRRVLELKIVTV